MARLPASTWLTNCYTITLTPATQPSLCISHFSLDSCLDFPSFTSFPLEDCVHEQVTILGTHLMLKWGYLISWNIIKDVFRKQQGHEVKVAVFETQNISSKCKWVLLKVPPSSSSSWIDKNKGQSGEGSGEAGMGQLRTEEELRGRSWWAKGHGHHPVLSPPLQPVEEQTWKQLREQHNDTMAIFPLGKQEHSDSCGRKGRVFHQVDSWVSQSHHCRLHSWSNSLSKSWFL